MARGHIAERYSLFVLIGLGEGIVGTVAALSAAVAQQGWTLGAGLVGVAGTGLTFGMWWIISSCRPRSCSGNTAIECSSGLPRR